MHVNASQAIRAGNLRRAMNFDVTADAYDRFMGRYSAQLSAQLADFAGIGEWQRVLDVGCGPGALTAELVRRVGPDSVTAVDPSLPLLRQPELAIQA